MALSLILALALATMRPMLAYYLNDTAVGVYHASWPGEPHLDLMFLWLGAAGGPALIVALERSGAAALAKAAREQAGLMIALALPPRSGLAVWPLADVLVGPALPGRGAGDLDRRQRPLRRADHLLHPPGFHARRRTGLLLAAMSVPASPAWR